MGRNIDTTTLRNWMMIELLNYQFRLKYYYNVHFVIVMDLTLQRKMSNKFVIGKNLALKAYFIFKLDWNTIQAFKSYSTRSYRCTTCRWSSRIKRCSSQLRRKSWKRQSWMPCRFSHRSFSPSGFRKNTRISIKEWIEIIWKK